MGIEERLDAIAGTRNEARRAEIERLLAQNPGRLLRASELKSSHLASAESPEAGGMPSLEQMLPECARIEKEGGTLLCIVNEVPVYTADVPPHPRGYVFSPSPSGPFPGGQPLGQALELLARDELLRAVELERLAFLDTETTGLAGPSGTYAFLIGLGYFVMAGGSDVNAAPRPVFRVEQYFMEDYCHEPAVLAHLRERLNAFDAFVTFNGKSFDLPLLRARYVLARQRIDLERPHLDLLHVARQIYRLRINSCSLSNVESEVLKLARTHDIEGRLIPQIYFDFLRGLHIRRMVPVFDHNVQDIVSMGSLLLLLVECLGDPGHPALEHARDVACFGRLHRRRGRPSDAVEYLERAVTLSREADLTNETLRELAAAYKKLGRVNDAAEIWRGECCRIGIANPRAYFELAKIYEHHLRDFAAALDLIADVERQASMARDLEAYGAGAMSDERAELLDDFARRRRRVERKLARLSQG